MNKGAIDVVDAYSTDGEIAYYDLQVLEDDLQHFPKYYPLYIYRADLSERLPQVIKTLQQLDGKISEAEMTKMNARAKLDKVPENQGLPKIAQLRLIELPLAYRSILAGIKTSAIINIGTATLGALIGAGGYGQPILTGIRLDDIGLILQGAIPAAALALLAQGLFELAERWIVPKGLQVKSR